MKKQAIYLSLFPFYCYAVNVANEPLEIIYIKGIKQSYQVTDLSKKIVNFVFSTILGLGLLLLLISCSQGPSKNQAHSAINRCLNSDGILSRTLAEEARFGYSAHTSTIYEVDVQKISSLNKQGDYYPVQARVKGVVTITPPLSFSNPESESTKPFDKVVWFQLRPEITANGRRSEKWFADTDHVENLSAEYVSRLKENSPLNMDSLAKAFQDDNARKLESQMNNMGKQMQWEFYTKPLIVRIIVWSLIVVAIGGVVGIIIHYLKKIANKKESIPTIQDTSEESIPKQIEQLAKLKEQGILSEAEFEEKKKELLSRL